MIHFGASTSKPLLHHIKWLCCSPVFTSKLASLERIICDDLLGASTKKAFSAYWRRTLLFPDPDQTSSGNKWIICDDPFGASTKQAFSAYWRRTLFFPDPDQTSSGNKWIICDDPFEGVYKASLYCITCSGFVVPRSLQASLTALGTTKPSTTWKACFVKAVGQSSNSLIEDLTHIQSFLS